MSTSATPSSVELPGNETMIVSTMLSDFYDSNSKETVVRTGRILCTLLRNAIKEIDDPNQQEKYRTIRLSNPKIKKDVVDVHGATELLMAAGFARSEKSEYLTFTPKTRNALELYLEEDCPPSQESTMITAVCRGLETKLAEIEFMMETAPVSSPSSKNSPNNNNNNNNSADSSPFLSEEERRKRQEKVKAVKKARREERKINKQRWQEDVETRKEAADRRAALLNIRASAESTGGNNDGGFVGSKPSVLPKPFEETAHELTRGKRRRMIQDTMKDPSLTPQEKRDKIQELMNGTTPRTGSDKASYGHGSTSVPPSTMESNPTGSSDKPEPFIQSTTNETPLQELTTGGTADVDMDNESNIDDEEAKKPAAVIAKKNPPDDLDKARILSPPSQEWNEFLDRTSRVAPADSIRETSVFYKKNEESSGGMEVAKCLKRLFREFDGLKTMLPSDPNCSIWLRFDEETPQYIRVLMAAPLPGPTPYSGGLFAFDMYVPNSYPLVNPKVQLLTTGGGTVRFGPNLYACGKVCLSLLGTWSGPKWEPAVSSLYQILISIQGLLLGVEHPYYLEPGHGGWEGDIKDGDFQSTGHTLSGKIVREEVGVPLNVVLWEDVIRVGTCKFSMHQSLQWSMLQSRNTGLEAFYNIIQAHFYENRDMIRVEIQHWMNDLAYGRIRNNSDDRFAIDELNKVIPKLESLLDNVTSPKLANSADAMDTEDDGVPHPGIATVAKTPAGVDGTSSGEAGLNSVSSRAEDQQSQADDALLHKIVQILVGEWQGYMRPVVSTTSAHVIVDLYNQETQITVEKVHVKIVSPKKPPTSNRINDIIQERKDTSTSGILDYVEEKRRKMEWFSDKGDYKSAGRIQEEINRLEDLYRLMKEAAAAGNYIRAGNLQHQLQSLTAHESLATQRSAQRGSVWNQAEEEIDSDEDMEEDSVNENNEDTIDTSNHNGIGVDGINGHDSDDEETDDDDDDEMSVGAPPYHSWGKGRQLGNPAVRLSNAIDPAAGSTQKSIELDRLCRLRIRLPNDKSVMEEFEKHEKLSAVYQRLEAFVRDDGDNAAASPSLEPLVRRIGGAFSQPLSSAGFTLLLARPKREFSLELHGTMSLEELNLSPSATLTMMKSDQRGIVHRGELESKLQGAQGDAMDIDSLTYEGLMELTERVGTATPQKGSAFLNLTRQEFDNNSESIKPSEYLAGLADRSDENDGELRCPICLGNYDDMDTAPLRRLKHCGHIMHQSCLETWLQNHSSCPLCKTSVVGNDN